MKKQKSKKPDGRRATCPRWDRWHIRIPNSEDQQKLINLYRKSGAKTKSDFVRVRLLGEAFKVITQDPAKEPYLEKLSEIVSMTHKIGMLYNEAVKALNTYPKFNTYHRRILLLLYFFSFGYGLCVLQIFIFLNGAYFSFNLSYIAVACFEGLLHCRICTMSPNGFLPSVVTSFWVLNLRTISVQ